MPTRLPPSSRVLPVVLTTALLGARGQAAEPSVPIERQVALMVATAGSDRNMYVRTNGKLNVLVVSKGQDGGTRRVVSTVLSALGARRGIAGMPHHDNSVSFSGAADLAEVVRAQRISLVFLTTSVENDVPAIARALEGVSVLTVAASADLVAKGAVIGFDLVSGRPQMFVNLEQAKRQKVEFEEVLLQRAKVVP
jgi:hypothetical protein